MFESTLARIPPPDRKTLKAFRFHFFHGRPGDRLSFPMLGGHSSTVYDDSNDLVALHATEDPDRLTVFVRDNFGFLFQVLTQLLGSQFAGYQLGLMVIISQLIRRQHQPGDPMYPWSDMRQAKRLPISSLT